MIPIVKIKLMNYSTKGIRISKKITKAHRFYGGIQPLTLLAVALACIFIKSRKQFFET
jgi:hypothetical protein